MPFTETTILAFYSGDDRIVQSGTVTNIYGGAGNDTIVWDGGVVHANISAGTGDDMLDLIVPDFTETITCAGTAASATLTYGNGSVSEAFGWTDFETVELTANHGTIPSPYSAVQP